MRILFTGASSFTGFWFANALSAMGHEVHAPLKRNRDEYEGVRKERIEKLEGTLYFATPYGEEKFLSLLEENSFDLFCHHAADVTNYKSIDFDPVKALANNSGPIRTVLELLTKKGCKKLLLTGSVFEPGEGEGSDNLKAVSPYGLSKGLTSMLFQYYCSLYPIHLGKFVIPNPFGPLEEFRFTSFLIKEWKEGKEAFVSMPSYIRDNVPVSLLAKAYAAFAEQLPETSGFSKTNPSFYKGSQGEFTELFSREMEKRLSIPCRFTLGDQKLFQEPKERVNTDPLNKFKLNWNEEKAWDEMAEYYAK